MSSKKNKNVSGVPAKKKVKASPKEPQPTSVNNSLNQSTDENPAEPSRYVFFEKPSLDILQNMVEEMLASELGQEVQTEPTVSADPPAQQPQSLPTPLAQQPQSLPTPPAQQPQSLPTPPVQQPQILLTPPAQQPQSLLTPPAQQPQCLPTPPVQQPQSLPTQTPQDPTTENPLRSSPKSKQPNDDGQTAIDNSQKSMSTLDRIKRIQQHLRLYLHATDCQRRSFLRELHNVEQIPCDQAVCKDMKTVLNHMSGCEMTAPNICDVPHCDTTRHISQHWKMCMRHECKICSPFKQAHENSRSSANSLYNRSPSALGAADIIYYLCHNKGNEQDSQQQTEEVVKPWHKSLSTDVRVSIIYKLVHTIFFLAEPHEILQGPQLINSIASARRVENFLYKASNNIKEYYRYLAEILFKLCHQINIPGEILRQQQLQEE